MLDKELIKLANRSSMYNTGDDCQTYYENRLKEFDTLFGDKNNFTEEQLKYFEERKEKYEKIVREYLEKDMREWIKQPSPLVTGMGNRSAYKIRQSAERQGELLRKFLYNKERFIENTKQGLANLIPIEEQLEKIRKTGKCGVIMADDIYAIEKLEAKLEYHENKQKIAKEANAYRRKHKTLEGFPHLDMETAKELSPYSKPFEAWSLTNNNNIIKKTKERLEELKNRKEEESDYIEKDWGQLIINRDISRVQFEFNAKPNEKVIELMKKNAFKWSPSNRAWQRILTDNAIKVANNILNKNLIEEVWEE